MIIALTIARNAVALPPHAQNVKVAIIWKVQVVSTNALQRFIRLLIQTLVQVVMVLVPLVLAMLTPNVNHAIQDTIYRISSIVGPLA